MRVRLGTVTVVLVTLLLTLTGCSKDEGNTATIRMRDYSYTVSGSLEAGTSTVDLENAGKELHMVAFLPLQRGKTLTDVRNALQSQDEAAFGQIISGEVGAPGGFLSPGAKAKVTTPFLTAGTYALVCFVPTEGDGAPHFAKGMINQLKVESGKGKADAGKVDATYAIGDGRVDGPRTLKSGDVTLRMTSAGREPHELLVVRKKDPALTFDDLDRRFTEVFEGDQPPPRGFAQQFPATIATNVFDVEPGKSVTVALNLPPGDYIIGCAREPDEDGGPPGAQPHRELLDVKVT